MKFFILIALSMHTLAAENLFKPQKLVKRFVSVKASNFAEQILLQTLSGLVAKSVNKGHSAEMVWIETGSPYYKIWLARQQKRQSLEKVADQSLRQALKYFFEKKIITKFILYTSKNKKLKSDEQINMATSLSAVYNAVAVDESLYEYAEDCGLELSVDIRGKTIDWCFENHKKSFNTKAALTQAGEKFHGRSFAVAQNMFTFTGTGAVSEDVYKWLSAPASIMGFNAAALGEDRYIEGLGDYGHICRVSDFMLNGAFLSMGNKDSPGAGLEPFNPALINWDKKSAVAFTLSDGDNLQWAMSDFYNRHYWKSKLNGSFAFGFGLPLGALSELSPDITSYISETKPSSSSVSINGGYFYADKIGAKLMKPAREILLRKIAKRLNETMKESGVCTQIIFVKKHSSPEAQQAYKVFTEIIDRASGFFIVQYAPYHAGKGRIYWNKNSNGEHIPAITCSEIIWKGMKSPGSGSPEKIAEVLNQKKSGSFSWVMMHAWSEFNIEGQKVKGLYPVKMCIEKMNKNISVVRPEELLWRIRMEKYPEETKKIIKRY